MLLVFLVHGSRDPRSQAGAGVLLAQVQTALDALVTLEAGLFLWPEVATLEAGPQCLGDRLGEMGADALAQGQTQVCVLPLFLLAGNHVRVDIPQMLETAKPQLPMGVTVTLAPYLGNSPVLRSWLRDQMHRSPQIQGITVPRDLPLAPQKPEHLPILLAHGSQRPEAHAVMVNFAKGLGVRLAYLMGEPSLKAVVAADPPDSGASLGLVCPFFLFEGSWMDTLTPQVAALGEDYPHIPWHLLPPLTQQSGFTTVVTQWIWQCGMTLRLRSHPSRPLHHPPAPHP